MVYHRIRLGNDLIDRSLRSRGVFWGRLSAVLILLGLLQIRLNLHQASHFWTLGLVIYLISRHKLSVISIITLLISHLLLLLLCVFELFHAVFEPSYVLSQAIDVSEDHILDVGERGGLIYRQFKLVIF